MKLYIVDNSEELDGIVPTSFHIDVPFQQGELEDIVVEGFRDTMLDIYTDFYGDSLEAYFDYELELNIPEELEKESFNYNRSEDSYSSYYNEYFNDGLDEFEKPVVMEKAEVYDLSDFFEDEKEDIIKIAEFVTEDIEYV